MQLTKLSIFFLFFISFSCWGNVYKWQDDSGKWHFSDNPPHERYSTGSIDTKDKKEKVLFEQMQTELSQRLKKKVPAGYFYQYIPKSFDKAFAIVVVNHGMFSSSENADRAAYNTSRRWQRFSEATGAIIISPIFDNFNYAVTVPGPQKWGYRGLFGRNYDADQFLNQIISYYRQANSKYDGKIFLSGHSAGAQFANRYLVRHPDKIHAAAFSAPAWFALPNYDHKWPNGMGKRFRVIRWEGSYAEKIIDITPSPNGWLKAAQLPVTVVVGELDLKKIRHVKGIGGDNHVERAKFWVNSMNQYAETNGKIGTVRLNIKEGVGHNFGKLAGVCQESIREHVESHLTSERKRIYGSKP